MSMVEPATNQLLEAALSYAARGWPVFPLHTPILSGGPPKCDCLKDACKNRGKHPRIRKGLNGATTDVQQITKWWDMWPHANVGVVTGHGLVVVDIDVRKGGAENWDALVDSHEKLPDTVQSITGSGGRHLLFHTDKRIPNSASLIANGIDVRGDGGYIAAPPSLHESGRYYEWEASSTPETSPVALLPAWILSLATRNRVSTDRTPGAALPEVFPEGQRNECLYKLGCSIWTRALSADALRAALLAENVVRCVPPLDEVEVVQIVGSIVSNKRPGLSPEYQAAREKAEQRRANLRVVRSDEGAESHAPPDSATPPDADSWRDLILLDKNGNARATFGNICLVLRNADEWRGKLRWNQMSVTAELDGHSLSDGDLGRIREAMETRHGVLPTEPNLAAAVRVVAEEQSYHPVQQYLKGLQWDGVERISAVMSDVLDCPQQLSSNELMLKVMKCWFVSAVARALRPGCKVDNVLVLVGGQGARKSSFFRELGSPWFSDTHMVLGDKDAYMQLADTWIYEWGEVEKITARRYSDETKAFLSAATDRFRLPFGRNVIQQPRSCIIVGSTNTAEFLSDDTGARRWWIVVVGKEINIAAVKDQRDQLWAEAVTYLNRGFEWHLSKQEEDELDRMSREFYAADPWEAALAVWLKARETATSDDALRNCLGIRTADIDPAMAHRIARVFRRLGWDAERVRDTDGRRYRVWSRRSQPEAAT